MVVNFNNWSLGHIILHALSHVRREAQNDACKHYEGSHSQRVSRAGRFGSHAGTDSRKFFK